MRIIQKIGLYGKRTFFFLVTNFLIVITLSLVVSVVFPYLGLPMEGMNFLLIIYSLIGMGGAFINLWMSKFLVVRAMGVKVLPPQGTPHQELIQKVHFLSKKAGLARMPEVGIYDSPDVNAFATGPSRNNSLVAVSSGLLRQMNDQETEGVLAHEVAHIANGDMVTMTLIMGVVNTMVMIIAHLLASMVAQALSRGRQGGGVFSFTGC